MPILKVPVTKGKGSVDVDTDKLPDAVYQEALAQGLKLLANRLMTKITVAKLEGEDLAKAQAAAMEQAAKNVEAMYAGNVRKTAAKSAKVSGAVNTEAMRLARILVKDALKHAGEKVSYYPASTITESAKALLVADPSILETAKANIEAAEAAKSVKNEKLAEIIAATKPSDKLIAKAAADAAKKKADTTLSKTQAGKPATRAKPGKQAQATA